MTFVIKIGLPNCKNLPHRRAWRDTEQALTDNPTAAYIPNLRSYNKRRGDCNMKKDSSVQLRKVEQKALENAIKTGIYKAMKEEGLITESQYVQLVANKERFWHE